MLLQTSHKLLLCQLTTSKIYADRMLFSHVASHFHLPFLLASNKMWKLFYRERSDWNVFIATYINVQINEIIYHLVMQNKLHSSEQQRRSSNIDERELSCALKGESFLFCKLNHIANISAHTQREKNYMCIKYNVLQLNENVSRGLSRSYLISQRNNHFIYDEARGKPRGEKIIQFEIALRDTPLISHNECLSFVDIMLNVLFA